MVELSDPTETLPIEKSRVTSEERQPETAAQPQTQIQANMSDDNLQHLPSVATPQTKASSRKRILSSRVQSSRPSSVLQNLKKSPYGRNLQPLQTLKTIKADLQDNQNFEQECKLLQDKQKELRDMQQHRKELLAKEALMKSRMNLLTKETIDMQRKTKEANKKRDEILFWQSKKTSKIRKTSAASFISPCPTAGSLPTIEETVHSPSQMSQRSISNFSARKKSLDDSKMKSFRDKLNVVSEHKRLATINEEKVAYHQTKEQVENQLKREIIQTQKRLAKVNIAQSQRSKINTVRSRSQSILEEQMSIAALPASPQMIRDVANLEKLEQDMLSRLEKASKRFAKEQKVLVSIIEKPEITIEQLQAKQLPAETS